MKKFALTLHFYSPRAYSFLRPVLSLPAPSSIANWTSSVNCDPGIFYDVFNFLQEKSKNDQNYKHCALLIDAMAIKSSILFDKSIGSYVGFVDFGKDIEATGDPDKPATEALVFLLVGLKVHWKTPIGYIFCDKIKAYNLTCFISKILDISYSFDIHIHSITFDGAQSNFKSVVSFGASFGKEVDDIKPNFVYGSFENPIHVIPDPCHMLKLARNALNDIGIFIDKDGNQIKWSYIKALHEIQEFEGLKFANKLSKKHIEFQRHKMNVKVAAQTFSNSVADAIEFLLLSGHPLFIGSEATISFIRVIDKLFDMLNSRSRYGKYFKMPLFLSNKEYWETFLTESISYLSCLKDINGTPLLKHRRKTFVLGLISAAISIKNLAVEILNLPSFEYLLTYKFSQDHLELLFACIRGKNGFNNNPNVIQFKSSLKRILLRNSIIGSKYANCEAFDSNSVGSVFSLKWNKHSSPIEEVDFSQDFEEEDIKHILEGNNSVYKEAILSYIAGYIIRRILKRISCSICSSALVNSFSLQDHSYSKSHRSLINIKNRGGLISPSDDVFHILSICEKTFKFLICGEDPHNLKINSDRNVKAKLIYIVNRSLFSSKPFKSLNSHDVEKSNILEDLHSTQLIKMISDIYFTMRLARYGQNYSDNLKKSEIGLQQQSYKLILFKRL